MTTVAIDVDGTTAKIPPRELLAASIEQGNPLPVTESIVESVLLNNPVVTGARNALRTLDRHFTIDLVTNRPEPLHPFTEKWAKENDLPHRNVRCVGMGTSKGELSDIDVVIDDSPHNVVSAAEHGRAGILFVNEHTSADSVQDRDDVYVARSWREIPELLGRICNQPVSRRMVAAD